MKTKLNWIPIEIPNGFILALFVPFWKKPQIVIPTNTACLIDVLMQVLNKSYDDMAW